MLLDRLQDFRHGFRQLFARPAFALTAIASLALGIGANTVLFGLVNELLLQVPAGTRDGARLVELGRGSSGSGFDTFAAPDLEDVRRAVPALESVFGYRIAPLNVREGTADSRRALGLQVSENYFDTLGVELALGRGFAAEGQADTPGVVISDAAWRTHFGAATDVIGRAVTINGASFVVQGVAPPAFRGHVAVLQPEFFVPLGQAHLIDAAVASLRTRRGARWLLAGGKLAPDATREQARSQLEALATRLATEYPDTHRDVHLDVAALSALPTEVRRPVQVFAGAMFALVGLILALACINVAGMLMARGEARRGEMAVRAAIGASRARLVYQLFAEGLTLALLAGVTGIGLAWIGRQWVRSIDVPAPFPLRFDVPLDAPVLGFALLASVVTALVFAAWPALRVSQRSPRAALGGGGATGTAARTRTRDLLVIAQFAVSVVLLIAAALFMRSLQRAAQIDPGFSTQHVAYAEFDLQPAGYPDARAEAVSAALLERVRALPGTESATVAATVPLGLDRLSLGSVRLPETPDRQYEPDANIVAPTFFRTLQIPLRGRDFAATDTAAADAVAIVNETLGRQLFGDADPLNRRFELGDHDDFHSLRVVGVVADGRYATLGEAGTPYLFVPQTQSPRQSMHLLLRSAQPPALLERELRTALRAVDPDLPPLRLHALEEAALLSVLPQRIAGHVATVVGLVGALLAATGLYGLMAYFVAQRRREIGVRLALGATRGTILRAVAARAGRLVGLGLALGTGLGVLMAQGLSGVMVGVEANDAVAFAAAIAGLLAAAVFATAGPALRASRVAPSHALRYE